MSFRSGWITQSAASYNLSEFEFLKYMSKSMPVVKSIKDEERVVTRFGLPKMNFELYQCCFFNFFPHPGFSKLCTITNSLQIFNTSLQQKSSSQPKEMLFYFPCGLVPNSSLFSLILDIFSKSKRIW